MTVMVGCEDRRRRIGEAREVVEPIEAGDFRRMTMDQRYQRYPTNGARRRFQG